MLCLWQDFMKNKLSDKVLDSQLWTKWTDINTIYCNWELKIYEAFVINCWTNLMVDQYVLILTKISIFVKDLKTLYWTIVDQSFRRSILLWEPGLGNLPNLPFMAKHFIQTFFYEVHFLGVIEGWWAERGRSGLFRHLVPGFLILQNSTVHLIK